MGGKFTTSCGTVDLGDVTAEWHNGSAGQIQRIHDDAIGPLNIPPPTSPLCSVTIAPVDYTKIASVLPIERAQPIGSPVSSLNGGTLILDDKEHRVWLYPDEIRRITGAAQGDKGPITFRLNAR